MTDMQTSLPLLIVWPSILNPVINFSALPCAFHSISSDVDATHAPTNHQMIRSTSYHHVTVLIHRSWSHLLFTVASVYRRQVLPKLHRHTQLLASKPPTCPSRLQLVHRDKPHLDLLHLDHMCKLCNIFKPFLPSWHMLLTHMYLWTNHLCISHKHN
jgi:hypothetical protein